MPKGIPNKMYTGEFKQTVVETIKHRHANIHKALNAAVKKE